MSVPFFDWSDDLDDAVGSICHDFADRESESEALAASAEFVAGALRGVRALDAYRHVLTFYGGGGTGKTTLSHRLESWLRGELVDDHWGAAPDVGRVVTVRWDVNDSHGDVDIVSLLLAFRSRLPSIPGGWRAFDLALLSYFQAARPGESLELAAGNKADSNLLGGIFDAIASDVGYVLDFGTGIAGHAIKTAVSLARDKLTQAQVRQYPRLPEIVDRCARDVSPTSPSPRIAAEVLRLATLQLSTIPDPSQRPLVVVFLDHFEKLQTDERRRDGEIAVNCLAAALPHSLIVITGRNSIDWDDPSRVDLRHAGPRTWPQLATSYQEHNPRQHRLGMLSPKDAASVYRRSALRQGFALSEATIARLCERDGWPLHIDAICTLAANLSGGRGGEVAAEELDRPLEDVVRRLLENLSDNQARAFHAACLLPYFDIMLAAVVAGVPQGDVAGMIRRALIEPTGDPRWPFRVHDTIREIIRRAPDGVRGGWTDQDWESAAHRGLTEAQRRQEEARGVDDDAGRVQAAALGITIAAQNGVWQEWLAEGAPAEAVASKVPASSVHPDADACVRAIHARVMPRGIESLRVLRAVFEGGTSYARHAGLWRAYKLRAWGHRDAAVRQLEAVVRSYPEWRIPIGQIGITLNEGRRFVDALAYAETVSDVSAGYIRGNQRLLCGDLSHADVRPWAERIAAVTSLRFRVELLSTETVWCMRTGLPMPVSEVEARYRRAVDIGHLGGQQNCLGVLARLHLASAAAFDDHMRELLTLVDTKNRPPVQAVEAQALRAMLTGDASDAHRARELAGDRVRRSASWIPAECYLEALGVPLDPVPAQWTEPYDDIRARWLVIGQGIIDRAVRLTR